MCRRSRGSPGREPRPAPRSHTGMTVRRPIRGWVAAGLMGAVSLAGVAGCGAQPATARPPPAEVAIAARMVVQPCTGVRPRLVPLPLAVLVSGSGRRLRVSTGPLADTIVRLAPGSYTIAPAGTALGRSVVGVRIDGKVVSAGARGHVVRVDGGRHRILVMIGLHPLECNGLAAGG